MYPSNPYQIDRRTLKFTGPLPSLLQGVASGGPLYIHARNWLAELAAIVPLGDMIVDDAENSLFFPDQGLHLSVGAVEAVHGMTIDYRSRRALALEIATRGEPRTLSVMAIPNVSNMEHFTRCLDHHPADMLGAEEYRQWRDEFTIRPVLCPCCEAAAEDRRAKPERNPLTKIFCHAIEHGLELRCHLVSPVAGFTTWLKPKNLQLSNDMLGIISEDGKSMLEVDLGLCHMLRIVCRVSDDEPFTEVHLYDSSGEIRLTIWARGWDKEAVWRGLCA